MKIKKSTKGAQILHLACQMGGSPPCLSVSYTTGLTPYFFPWPRSGFLTFLILERHCSGTENHEIRGWSHVHEKKRSGVEAVSFFRRLRSPAVGSKQIGNILLSSYWKVSAMQTLTAFHFSFFTQDFIIFHVWFKLPKLPYTNHGITPISKLISYILVAHMPWI